MKRTFAITSLAAVTLAAGAVCTLIPSTANQAVPLDGVPRAITSEVTTLGTFDAGDVLKITVAATGGRAAYVLRADASRPDAGVVVDGGPVNESFQHRVIADGELRLFVDVAAGVPVTVALERGSADFVRPAGQSIAFVFEDAFLVDGLYDPSTNDEADQELLVSIESQVRDGIIERLGEIFDGTGVTVLGPGDALPADVSIVTYTGQRELATGGEIDGLAVSGCSDIVVFGEVLPRGQNVDPGNRNLTDAAAVYTGSFRGTGDCDAGLVVNSVNNIINALALSGAHEAGHLLGLNHTALDGLMSSAPSFAIQRQLAFQRSQVALGSGDDIEVFTTVVQDPATYFDSIFAP